ncbi:MAG: UDP-N-acetylmuramate--L-alanine ligase [Roseiflexaceae bacterium]|nr:UDP-N-acetylmuramate--L-alanine ligase [Roseiflexaceae bacterium]
MTHYHIVGIAGAGMSAIAHILLDQGHIISGSDLQRSNLGDALIARGATIFQDHAAEQIAGADALVVTSAVQPDHVELQAASALGIPILKRADLWAEWSRVRPTVAVAGTHGKTTTTAMIALILTHAGFDPGFLIGGEAADLQTNARWGNPNAPLVIEADEYDRTFLAITSHIAIITNVEWDHVDIYPTQESYTVAFQQFAANVAKPRNVIVCADDPGALQAFDNPDATQYGIDETIARDPASCRLAPLDWTAANLRLDQGQMVFGIWRYDRTSYATRLAGQQRLTIPGVHNVRNALAALAACTALGVPLHVASEGLARYHGVARRFEIKGELDGITVIDDYAHHPTEVRATLAAARQRYQGRRIIAYLQPHTYSRTKALLRDWPQAFDDADLVLVGDIYAARERDTLGMSAERLAAAIGPRATAVGGISEAVAQILAQLQPNDTLLTLGAGDGHLVGTLVLEHMRRGHHE